MCLDDIDVTTLVPISQYARKLKVTTRVVQQWHSEGRWNRFRTRMVKLDLVWCSWNGYGINDQLYRRFLEDLNQP